MGIGIGQWPQAIVILLPRSIPKSQLNVLAINLNIGDVVLEHRWYVDLPIVARRSALSTGSRAGVLAGVPLGMCPSRTLSTSRSGKEVSGELGHSNAGRDLSASTISDDNELPADFGHVESEWVGRAWRVMCKSSSST